MSLSRMLRIGIRCESGATLVETLVALAVLSTVVVTFLAGISTTSKAAFLVDTRATAMSLAQSQMEWAQSANYTSEYSPPSQPSRKDYINYSTNITTQSVNGTDDSIQKIIVTVKRSGETVIKLEGYKVYR